MFTTKLDRKQLLITLRTNRDNHRAIYEAAFEKYRAAVLAEAARQLDDFQQGKVQRIMVHLLMPEDHTAEYDAVIGLLESAQEDLIQLNVEDYTQFYMDDWSWKRQWAATNATYLGNDDHRPY